MMPAHIERLMTFAQHGQPADYAASDMMRADLEQLVMAVGSASSAKEKGAITVFVYRHDDGTTQVRAPGIDDSELVVDMLEEGLRAMSEGDAVATQ